MSGDDYQETPHKNTKLNLFSIPNIGFSDPKHLNGFSMIFKSETVIIFILFRNHIIKKWIPIYFSLQRPRSITERTLNAMATLTIH